MKHLMFHEVVYKVGCVVVVVFLGSDQPGSWSWGTFSGRTASTSPSTTL